MCQIQNPMDQTYVQFGDPITIYYGFTVVKIIVAIMVFFIKTG